MRFSLQIFRMNDVSCHDTTDDTSEIVFFNLSHWFIPRMISIRVFSISIKKKSLFWKITNNPRILLISCPIESPHFQTELLQTFAIEMPEKPIFNISLRDVTTPATGFSRCDQHTLNHSKYSAAKIEIKGAIILIRRKELFPRMAEWRPIAAYNGQLFAADLLSLSCATTRVSVSYFAAFFPFHLAEGKQDSALPADNRAWPGWTACKHILLLFAPTPTRRALLRYLCIG